MRSNNTLEVGTNVDSGTISFANRLSRQFEITIISWVAFAVCWHDTFIFLTKYISRKITVTESAPVGTVTQTVATTTTFLLQCTNSQIHKPEDMCGDGSGPMPIFSYEAPTTTDHTTTDYTTTDHTTTDQTTTDQTTTDQTTTDHTTTDLTTTDPATTTDASTVTPPGNIWTTGQTPGQTN